MQSDPPESVPATRLGGHVFSAADQVQFAECSGDFNPMHVDPIAARRLISGRQVVHGIHTVLRALDLWSESDSANTRPVGLQCAFDHPVSVGDAVEFVAGQDAQGRLMITAAVDGLACTVVTLLTSAEGLPASVEATAPLTRDVNRLSVPLDEVPGTQVGQNMSLTPLGAGWTTTFPAAARVFGEPALAAIAALSYFVGMACPGLHSVFSSLHLRLDAAEQGAQTLLFTVKRYDSRFKLFIVAFHGAVQGELRAFQRPPPQVQPTTRALKEFVDPDEFSATQTLVIGGSRGLGEMTAKLLAAGGGEVLISYAQGRDDALNVAADINSVGLGRCHVRPFNLQSDSFEDLSLPLDLTTIYFFATPRIYRKKTGVFDSTLFGEFCTFYLDRFTALCNWLESRPGGRPVTVFLPSTLFIVERPKGMTEYAMAKAAAEVLAEDLNRSLRNVKVVHKRLPRLATDQTSSILGLTLESNVDSLLPLLRDVSRPAT
jgi:hypothetical protein